MAWSMILSGLVTGTFLALGSFGTVVWFVNPESGWLGWLLFFLTFFLASLGIISTAMLLARTSIVGKGAAVSRLGETLRWSLWSALLALFFAVMCLYGWLVWWSALFGVVFFLLIEMYFIRMSQSRTQSGSE